MQDYALILLIYRKIISPDEVRLYVSVENPKGGNVTQVPVSTYETTTLT